MALPTGWTHAINGAPTLQDRIAKVICESHQNAFAAATMPGEVDFVASLATSTPALLAPHLLTIAGGGHGVHVWSVFLHQSPKAEFLNSKSTLVRCELADLGLAVRFLDSAGGWEG